MENETEGLAARSVAGNAIAVLGFGFLWCAGFLAQPSYGFFGHEAIDAFMGMVSGIALIAVSFAMRACRARTALRVVAIGGYFLLVGVMSFGGAAGGSRRSGGGVSVPPQAAISSSHVTACGSRRRAMRFAAVV